MSAEAPRETWGHQKQARERHKRRAGTWSGLCTARGERAATPLTRPKASHEGREQKEVKAEGRAGPGGPEPREQAQEGGGGFLWARERHPQIFVTGVS